MSFFLQTSEPKTCRKKGPKYVIQFGESRKSIEKIWCIDNAGKPGWDHVEKLKSK